MRPKAVSRNIALPVLKFVTVSSPYPPTSTYHIVNLCQNNTLFDICTYSIFAKLDDQIDILVILKAAMKLYDTAVVQTAVNIYLGK